VNWNAEIDKRCERLDVLIREHQGKAAWYAKCGQHHRAFEEAEKARGYAQGKTELRMLQALDVEGRRPCAARG
jgi:hypothetical protein